MKIVLALIIVFNNTFVLANESYEKELDQIIERSTKDLEYRNNVNQISYAFTEKLCYVYKFNKANGLPLKIDYTTFSRNKTLFYQAFAIDPLYRSSMMAWNKIIGYALISPYYKNRSNSFFYGSSEFIHSLIISENFRAASLACGKVINEDVHNVLVDELTVIDRSGGIAGVSIPGFGVLGLLKKLSQSSFILKLADKTPVPLRKTLKISGITVLAASTIGVIGIAALSEFDKNNFEKEIQQLDEETIRSSLKTRNDQLNVRNILYFAKDYADWSMQPNKTTDPPEILLRQFVTLKKHSSFFNQKQIELEQNLSQHSEQYLISIIEKSNSRQQLTEKEATILLDLQFLGSINILFGLNWAIN